MTLIAGFRSFGTPTLIGDFLITTGDAVAGLRKKVLIVADNFALAWTGHLLAADSVVKSLQSYLDLDAVQIEAVRAILTNRTTSDLGTLHVSLICWVIDNQGDHCFRWNSQDPNKVRWGAPIYDGSGESFVEALVGGGLRDSFKPTSIDPDRTVDGALDVTTKLMVSEMLGPSTHPHGFGFAYEIIQGKSHRFEYVDNILYFAVTHELDDTGKHFSSHFAGSIYKCISPTRTTPSSTSMTQVKTPTMYMWFHQWAKNRKRLSILWFWELSVQIICFLFLLSTIAYLSDLMRRTLRALRWC